MRLDEIPSEAEPDAETAAEVVAVVGPAPTPAKKRRGPRAKVGPTTAKTTVRRAQVLELSLEGLSCPQIAEKLGIHKDTAYEHLEVALKEEFPEHTAQLRHAWKLKNLGRLEALFRKYYLLEMKDEDTGSAKIGKLLVDIIKAQTSMLGHNAPVKVEQSGPEGGPMQVVAVPAFDLSKLTTEELLAFEQLRGKLEGKA